MALSPEIIQVLNPRWRRAESTEDASGRRGSVIANCAASLKLDSFPFESDRGRSAKRAMLCPAVFHVEAELDQQVPIGAPSKDMKASLPTAASYWVSLADV